MVIMPTLVLDHFNRRIAAPSVHIAEAFSTTCSITDQSALDWYLNIGASVDMTHAYDQLNSSMSYTCSDTIVVGNGALLSISRIGSCSINASINLSDVLVVPGLTKNMFSVSKLTSDSPIDVVFH